MTRATREHFVLHTLSSFTLSSFTLSSFTLSSFTLSSFTLSSAHCLSHIVSSHCPLPVEWENEKTKCGGQSAEDKVKRTMCRSLSPPAAEKTGEPSRTWPRSIPPGCILLPGRPAQKSPSHMPARTVCRDRGAALETGSLFPT